ncbi:FkbM family methyltransferase [Teredinibacter haidensis]|uniref:FkbM family methyltransferase n=1 Tax=Teredinibacter haidensis TaxID=2731755 RepID=UPI000948A4BA|nr:FkbM family methyltransferase [Teredinibacter haidensis]
MNKRMCANVDEHNCSGFLTHRDDVQLADNIRNVLHRFFIEDDRSEDVHDLELTNRREDVFVSYIEDRINNANCYDKDLIILSAFKNDEDLILDIGANWGYSVADLWSYGAGTRILSFEPVKFYAPLLEKIKEMRPGKYEYKLVALFDEPSTLKFVVPVVNNLPVFALSTAVNNPNIEFMVKDICFHIKNYMKADDWINVRMHEFLAPVDTLDNQLKIIKSNFSWKQISAIKIDVEGLEYYVLKGGFDTIVEYCPLIMIEDGNRNKEVTEFLEKINYIFAVRLNEKLVFSDVMDDRVNGFFVHSSKIEEYKNLGIL